MKVLQQFFFVWHLCLMVLCLLLAPASEAGVARVGNGGGFLVCEGSWEAPKGHMLYDFFDVPELRQFPSHMDADVIIADVLSQLYELRPTLAVNLNHHLKDLQSLKKLVPRKEIEWVEKGDGPYEPANCQFHQVANTWLDQKCLFEPTTMNIDKQFWAKMSEREKAGLLLHEAAFVQANRQYNYDSLLVHPLVGIIFSQRLKRMSTEELNDYLLGTPFYYNPEDVEDPFFPLPSYEELEREMCTLDEFSHCRFCSN